MLVWAVILGLGVWLIDSWMTSKTESRVSINAGGELVLEQTRNHHYVVQGAINGVPVTFFLDTGATSVSVPKNIAEKANLSAGYKYWVSTANGDIQVSSTTIDRLSIAHFDLTNIAASINPHDNSDYVLLGMSALKHFAMSQQGNRLIMVPQTGVQ